MIREGYVKNGTGSKEPVFRFDIDELQSRYPGYYVHRGWGGDASLVLLYLQNWYCWYLYNKCLMIEMWDAESQFHFGTVKVPLRQLMR